MADDIFSYLKRFYKQTEKLLGVSFYTTLPIYKPFTSIKEQNDWSAKSVDPIFENYIERIWSRSDQISDVNAPFGGVVISQGGILDTQIFLDNVKSLLQQEESFKEEYFDCSHISLNETDILYKDCSTKHLIFCEGIRANDNPYFKKVPIRSLKGEVIEIEMKGPTDRIYKQSIYVVPTRSENVFRVGATYDRENVLPGTTIYARNELESKLKELLTIDFNVTNQDWGIRPTTPDRKPVLGSHPVFKNIVMFNGLGTKGVSLAPYFSARLMEWLDGEISLDREFNISRFKSLYSRFE